MHLEHHLQLCQIEYNFLKDMENLPVNLIHHNLKHFIGSNLRKPNTFLETNQYMLLHHNKLTPIIQFCLH